MTGMNDWVIWSVGLLCGFLFLWFLYKCQYVWMLCAAFLFMSLLNAFNYFGNGRAETGSLIRTAGSLALLLLGIVFYQCIKWSEQHLDSLNTRLSVQQEVQDSLKEREQDLQGLASRDMTQEGLALIADFRQMIRTLDSPQGSRELLCAASASGILDSPERWTSFPEVNAVIEQEKRLSESRGIPFDADIDLPAAGAIEPLDLCIILLNLLDNAIRACSLMEKPGTGIQLSVAVKGAYLTICCRNDSSRHIERMIRKTGQGMHILQSMARKYRGRFMTERSANGWKAALVLECL